MASSVRPDFRRSAMCRADNRAENRPVPAWEGSKIEPPGEQFDGVTAGTPEHPIIPGRAVLLPALPSVEALLLPVANLPPSVVGTTAPILTPTDVTGVPPR